ncbi:MAG: putative aminohydrolase SsnA [Bacteroidota bacterium]|nr:putative aminohydrolase SsnA [Bacteroidota bacterium]
MNYLLKNSTILNLFPSEFKQFDVRISDEKIIETGKSLKQKSGEEIIDCSGKFIMPGLVNSHTHLYSALARGMSGPKKPPSNFLEILQKIWWKLDEALDEESVYYSGLVGAIEAIKYGTTTLIDHHASPNYISGSLGTLKNAMEEVGLRGILCYETTDRGGIQKRDEGLDENESFIIANQKNPFFRGMVGAHASFTLSEDSLKKLGELVQKYDNGIHIHVAEDKADVSDCLENYQKGLVDRLKDNGLLNSKSIYAHGVHLTRDEIKKIKKAKTWLIHNPRSNMNNRVGYAPLSLFGERTALGTDGFPADMFEEAKIGFFRNQESSHQTRFTRIAESLQTGNTIISEIFVEKFGVISKGNQADLVILDYKSPTPLSKENLLGHFIFGMNSSIVESVMVGGKWILWNKQVLGIDEEAVMVEAQKVAKRLWKRMAKNV